MEVLSVFPIHVNKFLCLGNIEAVTQNILILLLKRYFTFLCKVMIIY